MNSDSCELRYVSPELERVLVNAHSLMDALVA